MKIKQYQLQIYVFPCLLTLQYLQKRQKESIYQNKHPYLYLSSQLTPYNIIMKVFQNQIQEILPIEPYQEISYFIRRPAVIKILENKGIKHFFPIQYNTFDHIKFGADLIGRDKTGSGKTIAYTLPILQRLRNQQLLGKRNALPKFLIILPTRELAIQVKNQIQSLRLYPQEIKILAVYGGTPISQHIHRLHSGVDIVAATPGRLIDLLTRGQISLKELQTICLDEADQMLKQGFQEDIEKILQFINRQCPYRTQKLLFSATVPRWVQQLTLRFMQKSRIFIDLLKNSQLKTPKTITHLCMASSRNRKNQIETIQNLAKIYAGNEGSLIIFCETKREANQLYSTLVLPQQKSLLHGDIPQSQRQYTFKNFKEKKIKCLVATNVAARGLDIPSVDLIIQLQPPKKVDDYVHRAGRTARAGKSGVCITFYNQQQRYLIKQIAKVASIKFTEIAEPSQADVMKSTSKELVQHIKTMDEGLVEYFEEAAKELIVEVGAEKALALALAQISGIKTPPRNYSIQTNIQGYMTYAFSGQTQGTNRKDLIEYLSCNLQRFSDNDITNVNNLTTKTVVFDMRENFRKKMQNLIANCEKKDNILDSIYKLRVVCSKQNLQDFKDDQDDFTFTAEEYQEAIHNKNQLEVVVKGFGPTVNEDTLFRFFKDMQIIAVQINLLKNEKGHTGLAFVLLLNQNEKGKALQLNSKSPRLQNRIIIIEKPKRK